MGSRAGLDEVVVAVVVEPAFEDEPAPKATVAPTRAHAASAAAPAAVFQTFRVMKSFLIESGPPPGHHANLENDQGALRVF